MSFPDHHSGFMLPPIPFAADDDSNGRWPQFPINNELFDSHSTFDQFPPFKRPRTSESNHFDPSPFPPAPPMDSRMQNPQNPPTNRGGTSHIFFKTRLCAKFRMGTCRNGESCNFAHGNEDMRQPPPNWPELVGLRDEERSSGNWDDDQKIIHKMKLCKKYYNGEECPYGERCNFLHEDPSKFRDDAGRCRESSAISLVANGSPKSHLNAPNNSDNNKNVNNGCDGFRTNGKAPFWKTKLCSKWEITGQCPFGDKCHFAHGQADLQVPGGRIEAETIVAASIPVIDVSPINAVSILDSKEDEQKKKNLLKWKINKKVDRIYADWLDDLPLPR
ncbi:hypothetical protein QN277_006969 [Acacia crassicarpa]|uniref:C3H1-type domain-containing protein n=1 Tax=Acacia crassicarpa TaxID=499986 RepID=A0AAE1JQG0_9FABA|nr:hypothetical protein QN277_006969 [Acacia crassicarpa]